MTYEVELKFFVAGDSDEAPFTKIESALKTLGAERAASRQQVDTYFAHPSKDFAATDEALRIRSEGNRTLITYKGPVVDSQTKTRREIEVLLGDEAGKASDILELLKALEFRPVHQVIKKRLPFHLQWEGRSVELALDDVEQLGTFIEIETLADDSDRAAARDGILSLAKHLELNNPEPKTYLCLLLEGMGP